MKQCVSLYVNKHLYLSKTYLVSKKSAMKSSKFLILFVFLIGSFSVADAGSAKNAVQVSKPVPKIAVISTVQSAAQAFVKTVVDSKRHLAAAAVARSLSVFTMYPVDTVKTRMQMGKKISWALSSLYNGVGGSLIGQVPYG